MSTTLYDMKKTVEEIFENKNVVVIGNAISLDKDVLKSITENKENLITCAFNKGVERFKPDVAFLSNADHWVIKQKLNVEDAFTIHCSPKGRPSEYADYAVPLNIIKTLREMVEVNRPSSGLIANAFLCQKRLKIKSVTLIGFDFKKTPTFYDLDRCKFTEPHDYVKEEIFTKNFFIDRKKYKLI
jgi:hypothetical protein